MSLRHRAVLAGLGLILVAVLLSLARPGEVLARLVGVRWPHLAAAFGWAAAVAALRAVRLRILVGPTLSVPRSVGVVTVTQAAVSVLPLRLGELSLVWLLRRSGVPGAVRGLSFLVVLRAMDAAGLLVWAVALALAAGMRLGAGAALLAGMLLLLVLAMPVATRALDWAVRVWRSRPGWRRRLLRQMLAVRRELRMRAASRRQVALMAVVSLALWAGGWGQTVALVRGMGLEWPASAILAGVIGAAVTSAVPVTTVGSFGTLEAGWALALAAAGVPGTEALAVGFATHLWSVGFSLTLAAAGWILGLRHPARNGGDVGCRSGRRGTPTTP